MMVQPRDDDSRQASPVQAERLYSQYGTAVYRRCRRLLGNDQDAHDACQEVFARAFRCYGDHRGEGARLHWLMRISTNHCLNQIRNRKNRHAKLDQRQTERPGHGAGFITQGGLERRAMVRQLLADADPELQQLAIHYWFDDMSKEEIAQHVGLSVPTVRKRLRLFLDRARKTLSRGLVGVTS